MYSLTNHNFTTTISNISTPVILAHPTRSLAVLLSHQSPAVFSSLFSSAFIVAAASAAHRKRQPL
jgi:hypothetical protein